MNDNINDYIIIREDKDLLYIIHKDVKTYIDKDGLIREIGLPYNIPGLFISKSLFYSRNITGDVISNNIIDEFEQLSLFWKEQICKK